MASPFDNMTDDELLKFVREYGKETAKPEEHKPEKLRVQVGDAVIEADTPEELQRLVQAKFSEVSTTSRPIEEPKRPDIQPAKPEPFDMKKFTETFVNDPDAGLEYLETVKYGMPVRKAVPQMLGALMLLGQKVQELEAASFAPQDTSERKVVENIMRERNWQPSRQSFEDARDIARARGLLKAKAEETTERPGPERDERGRFIPPRVPRVSTEEAANATDAEILRAGQNMSPEKLEALLIEAGVIKTSHFGQ